MYRSLCLCLSYYLLCYNHFSALGLLGVLGFLLLLLFLSFGLFVLLVFCYCLFCSFLFWGFFSEYSVKIERKLKFSVSSAFAKGDIYAPERRIQLSGDFVFILLNIQSTKRRICPPIYLFSPYGEKRKFQITHLAACSVFFS